MTIAKVAVRIALRFRWGRRCRANAAVHLLSTRRRRFDRKAGHSGHDGLGNEHHADYSNDANDRSVDVTHRMIPKSCRKLRQGVCRFQARFTKSQPQSELEFCRRRISGTAQLPFDHDGRIPAALHPSKLGRRISVARHPRPERTDIAATNASEFTRTSTASCICAAMTTASRGIAVACVPRNAV